MADPRNATPSAPWFSVGDTKGNGLSLTSQYSALNEGVNGIAQDLSDQSAALIVALTALLAALT